MHLTPIPLPKVGACPAGYHPDGQMCVPRPEAMPAVLKNGPCPSGWHSDGNYCVANDKKSRMVIPKRGACPNGYYADGAYCVQI